MPTVLQLSDLHLMSDPAGELKGVRIREITERVIDCIRQRVDSVSEEIEHVVITGDLAHDELRETYDLLRELLGDLLPRCLLLPGNHDSRPGMRAAFPELFAADDEFLTFSVTAGPWRLIGLDSHVPGNVSGHLCRRQLDWLEHELQQHAAQPAVLFLHHPPFSVGSAWVDVIGLTNADELLECVLSAGKVRAICAGHVHQQYEAELNGVRLLAAPSASLQFTPASDEFGLDAKPTGFRLLRLGEHFESEVVRLPH